MSPGSELRKTLGRKEVLGLAFGAMIGWGWVVLSGEMIDRAGSVGSVAAFLLGALMVLFVGLTYAELTAALSREGGALTFTYAAMGPKVSYLCGWALILAYFAVCAFEAVAFPAVAAYLMPGLQMGYLYSIQGADVHLSWVLAGCIVALAIGVTNYCGIRFSAFLQWLATLLLLAIGAAFFLQGNLAGSWENLRPEFTDVGGFFRVVIMTPFLFLGFDIIPQVSEEIKVPARALGKLILTSIAMAFAWYGLVQWTVGLSLDHAARTASSLPTADAMAAVYGSPLAGHVLVFGGLLGILTSWNGFFIGATRLFFAMGRARMLPEIFCRLHPRFGTPSAAIVLMTLLTMGAPFFGRPALVWLVDAGSFATVVVYLLVAAAFLLLHRRYPHLPRPYRVGRPRLIGGAALVATVFFAALYLPGSPSALLWPYEWLIVLIWSALGALLGLRLARRLPREEMQAQAEYILGDYAALLEKSRSA
ncbi:MAG: amino acid permease, partial [Acidobacteriota bacterium]